MTKVTFEKDKRTAHCDEDKQTLALQVEALQAQLEEQTKLAKDQVELLLIGV